MGGRGGRSGLRGGGGGGGGGNAGGKPEYGVNYNTPAEFAAFFPRNLQEVAKHFATYIGKPSEVFMEALSKAPIEVQNMFAKYADKLKAGLLKPNDAKSAAYFDRDDKRVHIDIRHPEHASRIDQTPYEVLAHEYGHLLDYWIGNKSYVSKQKLAAALEKDYENMVQRTISKLAQFFHTDATLLAVTKAIKSSSPAAARAYDGMTKKGIIHEFIINEYRAKYNNNKLALGNFSDTLEGLGVLYGSSRHAAPFGTGHSLNYWKEFIPRLYTEAFAEITSSIIMNPTSLKTFETELPNTVAAYWDILKGIK